jgi:predicted metalloprotease
LTRTTTAKGIFMNRLLSAAVAAASTALLITGCAKPHDSKPDSVAPDPSQIAGRPITEGPSGLRPGAPGPTRPIVNTDNGEIDHIAGMSIADIEEFWTAAYGEPLKGKFTPVNSLFSYDLRYKHGTFCGSPTYEDKNAGWCPVDGPAQNCPSDGSACSPAENTIGWDRGALLPEQRAAGGDIAVTFILAHEYGHAITWAMADLLKGHSLEETLASEQQADCFAGTYIRWVVDDKSPRFTLNTGEGLTKLLVAMIGSRDPLISASDPNVRRLVHGSAFDRVTAFQMGFNHGASACPGIDPTEIKQRRAKLPKELLEQGQTGEVPITQDSVKLNIDALTKVFSPAEPPTISFDQPSCPDAKPTPPASYCPATNTIAIDMDRLILMGTSLSRGTPLDTKPPVVFGDATAYSVLMSRYMLAVQKERGGLSLDDTHAGLRTACLTGVASTKLSSREEFKLTGGDLDETITGLLTNGLIAANVNGDYAPNAFARAEAFRTGVLGDEDSCYKRWP